MSARRAILAGVAAGSILAPSVLHRLWSGRTALSLPMAKIKASTIWASFHVCK